MKKSTFLQSLLAAFLFTIVLAGCSKSSDNPGTDASPNTIHMKNSVFSVQELKISSGTTVTWINDDTKLHSVTAKDDSFDSGDMPPGASYSRTFTTTGTITYYSKHWFEMEAKITVTP